MKERNVTLLLEITNAIHIRQSKMCQYFVALLNLHIANFSFEKNLDFRHHGSVPPHQMEMKCILEQLL